MGPGRGRNLGKGSKKKKKKKRQGHVATGFRRRRAGSQIPGAQQGCAKGCKGGLCLARLLLREVRGFAGPSGDPPALQAVRAPGPPGERGHPPPRGLITGRLSSQFVSIFSRQLKRPLFYGGAVFLCRTGSSTAFTSHDVRTRGTHARPGTRRKTCSARSSGLRSPPAPRDLLRGLGAP